MNDRSRLLITFVSCGVDPPFEVWELHWFLGLPGDEMVKHKNVLVVAVCMN